MKDGQVAWSEKFVQDLIAASPQVLGLGPFTNVHREQVQPKHGRVDLILSGDHLSARYVVEIQLGKTDPDHIIRTIQYWNYERKSRPEIDHVAVLIAEEISGRFHDVISLFNEKIPLIALKMTAFEMDGKTSILFTRVLDIPQNRRALAAEDAKDATNTVGLGLPQSSSEAMKALLEGLTSLANETMPQLTVEPHQSYTSVKDQNWNVVSFVPKKAEMWVSLHVAQEPEMDARLAQSGLDYEFNVLRGKYVVQVTPDNFESRRKELAGLFLHTADVWQEQP